MKVLVAVKVPKVAAILDSLIPLSWGIQGTEVVYRLDTSGTEEVIEIPGVFSLTSGVPCPQLEITFDADFLPKLEHFRDNSTGYLPGYVKEVTANMFVLVICENELPRLINCVDEIMHSV